MNVLGCSVVVFLSVFNLGSALLCYNCYAGEGEACAEPPRIYEIPVVQCGLQTSSNITTCYNILLENNGVLQYIRQCGPNDEEFCPQIASVANSTLVSCETCAEDRCNAVPSDDYTTLTPPPTTTTPTTTTTTTITTTTTVAPTTTISNTESTTEQNTTPGGASSLEQIFAVVMTTTLAVLIISH